MGPPTNVRITAIVLPAPSRSPLTISEGIGYVVSAAREKPPGIIGTRPRPKQEVLSSIIGVIYKTKVQPEKALAIKATRQIILKVSRYFFVLSRTIPVTKAPSTPAIMKKVPNSEINEGL